MYGMQFGQFSPSHLNILQIFLSNSQFEGFSNKTQSSCTLVGINGKHVQGKIQNIYESIFMGVCSVYVDVCREW
jgi:hypothetical protein